MPMISLSLTALIARSRLMSSEPDTPAPPSDEGSLEEPSQLEDSSGTADLGG
jgi:hypothetical protein